MGLNTSREWDGPDILLDGFGGFGGLGGFGGGVEDAEGGVEDGVADWDADPGVANRERISITGLGGELI